MITSPDNNEYFMHETAGLSLTNLEEPFTNRYWWALRFSDHMAKLEHIPSSEVIVRELNSRLLLPQDMDQSRRDAGQVAGKYRTGNVSIKSATVAFADHKFIPELMANFGSRMDKRIVDLDKKKSAGDFSVKGIIETVSYCMYWISRIHPFAEGNGRVSREFAQILLKRYGLPLVFVTPINRDEYIKSIIEVDRRTRDVFALQGAENLNSISTFLARSIVNQADYLGVDDYLVRECSEYADRLDEQKRNNEN
ncbi:MAG: Fic family protein [Patescibacteria group bacterium]